MELTPQILKYDKTRDFNDIFTLFKQERNRLHSGPILGNDIKAMLEKYTLTEDNTLVCRTNTEFIGFVQFFCSAAYYCCCGLINLGPQYSINYIAVKEKYRKKGHGTNLMNQALTYMAKQRGKSLKQIDAFTLNDNVPADKLLRKTGFACSDSRPSRVLYTKTLSSPSSLKP